MNPSSSTNLAERAPTYDLLAEKAVLGTLMTIPGAIADLDGILNSGDFYSPKHADIFDAITTMFAAGKPTEMAAVAAYLADSGNLERVGGVLALHECHEHGTLAGQIGYYANRVANLADARQVEANAIQIGQAVTAPGRDLDKVAELAAQLATKMKPRRQQQELTTLGSLINPGLDQIEANGEEPELPGLSTGIRDLDDMLGGIRRQQLITIAAGTSMGKSITLIDFARHMAIKHRKVVAFFSLEMTNSEVFNRIIAAEASVMLKKIRTGKLGDDDWQRIAARIGPMTNAPLLLSDKKAKTVASMKAQCEKVLRAYGQLDAVFVDHMHLVRPSHPRIIEERARLEDVSEGLKLDLAGELDVPVIAAAQLNRNPNARNDKLPELTDLKGSSSIEQMSNIVIILHRPDYYDANSPRAGEADYIVAKNRDGEKGTVTVAAQLHLARFRDTSIPAAA